MKLTLPVPFCVYVVFMLQAWCLVYFVTQRIWIWLWAWEKQWRTKNILLSKSCGIHATECTCIFNYLVLHKQQHWPNFSNLFIWNDKHKRQVGLLNSNYWHLDPKIHSSPLSTIINPIACCISKGMHAIQTYFSIARHFHYL